MAEIQGRRLPDETGDLPVSKFQPGDYCKVQGEWWVRPPQIGAAMGRLTEHEITEHEDGTITVSPSILLYGGNTPDYHGWLEHGVWRDA